ncbi:hypothetical protein D3C71_1855890 [compost metagenome]
MTVRIVQRITLNFGVVARVIHQHILTVRRLRKAVMPRSVLTIFIACGKHRARRFVPVGGVTQVSAFINPQQPHAVILIRRAGRVADKQPVSVLQHRRAFVDPESAALPVILGFAEQDGRTRQRPRVFHLAEIEIGVP